MPVKDGSDQKKRQIEKKKSMATGNKKCNAEERQEKQTPRLIGGIPGLLLSPVRDGR